MMTKLTIILIILFSIIGIFFMKTLAPFYRILKNYRKLGKEEFMKRLKDGAEAITPVQKTKAQLNGKIITLLGILIGIVATPIVKIEGVWFWVLIILVGSLLVSGFDLLGTWQLYKVQKQQDAILNSLEEKNDQ